ncbi:PREDICTED: protein FAR1-RELATED SEQUENCE 5-like [Lupinus angustifolius]|uniref:protein FAR1-RELATED SEQUENCE 5-like n=1 Tax=Lupinus angustifolius TaxID=3871 RepID=UPI00092F6885|nr:PREDICTED: protein FAR1-RELATED SEQUENCE 5-like [Lupinus angustifolius]
MTDSLVVDEFDNSDTENMNETEEDLGFEEIDFALLNVDEVKNFRFLNNDFAYEFYKMYGMKKGFAIRKYHTHQDKDGEIVWQSFFCDREGFREKKDDVVRKRVPRKETRCGCLARMKIHVDKEKGGWYVSYFSDEHSHEVVGEYYGGMIAYNRRMTETNIGQMNTMRELGIGTGNIFASFADQYGGYHYIGFSRKDMYNQIQKQRRIGNGDAEATLQYLKEQLKSDSVMYWRHTVDEKGKLQHLLWADECSIFDYSIFRDVLAFDATYGRNNYKFSVVVFSGVNHHKQITIFVTVVVSNETEETYVWILEIFLEAMNGKQPKCVITNGDLAMKNSIQRVFPETQHRLCALHICNNAGKNIKKKNFHKDFQKVMLNFK